MFTKQSYTLRFKQDLSRKDKFPSSGRRQDSLTGSLKASTTTDNCTANVTVSDDVALPIAKQGTFWVTPAYSKDHNIVSSQLKETVINGAAEPVPSATYSRTTIPIDYTTLTAFQNQIDNVTVHIQFFSGLGQKTPFFFDTTSGIFDANPLFSGRNWIRIKNDHGSAFRYNLTEHGA